MNLNHLEVPGGMSESLSEINKFIATLLAYADNEYCRGIGVARSDLCLGWEAKVKAGKFGEVELTAHKSMNRHFGAHFGIYEAVARARDAIAKQGA